MGFLQGTYLGNSLQAWSVAVGLVILVFVAVRMAERMLEHYVRRLAGRTENEIDDLAADLVERTRIFFPLVLALYAGAAVLTLPDAVENLVRAVTVIGVLFQAALWANGLITFVIDRHMRRRMEQDAAAATSIGALRFVGKLAVWALVLLLALDNLGYDITALVAGLGIGGIAVALALQNILGDLFASLSIVLDKPFVIGDFIIVGDLLGTVEHIGLKTTRVRSLSGEQLVFANSDLLNSRIRNFKRMFERRVVFTVGVTYQTPREQLAAISGWLREVVESQEDVRFDRAHLKEFGDSAIVYEIVYYVLVPDYNAYMDIQEAINLGIVRRFEEEDVDFAYPTRTLYLHQTDQTDPARETTAQLEG